MRSQRFSHKGFHLGFREDEELHASLQAIGLPAASGAAGHRCGPGKYPPAEPGALGYVSRSKRLEGVANATPQGLRHPFGGGSLPQRSPYVLAR